MKAMDFVRMVRFRILLIRDNYQYGRMDRKQTFQYIYAKNKWGGVKSKFYSGPGSHERKYVEPYCKLLRKWIRENGITSVCDLGCGDFNVAAQWLHDGIVYDGVDIVQEMIDAHNAKYGTQKIRFHCLDIVEDALPDAQLCLIRQVLQHCSNDEISCILKKTEKYEFVLITEHITRKEFAAKYNIDKAHGSHTRVYRQSGLYFDEKPFSLETEVLLEIPYEGKRKNESMITVLIKNPCYPG